jgi:hypothetical protein
MQLLLLHEVHKVGAYFDCIQFHVNIVDLLNSQVEHRLQNKLSGEVFFPVAKVPTKLVTRKPPVSDWA